MFLRMTPSQIFQSYNVFIVIEIILQALSGDFQHACGKMRAQILLGVRWCAMRVFFQKVFIFIKGLCVYA